MPTPENDPAGRFGGAWERQPGDNRGVWLWVIYRADIHVLGAIRRATRLHWNADGAKEEVCGVVNRLWSSSGAEIETPIWDTCRGSHLGLAVKGLCLCSVEHSIARGTSGVTPSA